MSECRFGLLSLRICIQMKQKGKNDDFMDENMREGIYNNASDF